MAFANQATVTSTSDEQDFDDMESARLRATPVETEDGNDHIEGGDGDDHILAEAGDDVLRGGAGRDALSGGDGSDRLWADNTDSGDGVPDRLDGSVGPDTLTGGTGNNVTSAGTGRGLTSAAGLFGGPGNDFVIGGAGDDDIFGGLGSDHLKGNDGRDRIAGDQPGLDGHPGFTVGEPDLLNGGDGIDLLFGQGGNDGYCARTPCSSPRFNAGHPSLSPGVVSSELFGGGGRDRIHGGEGHDRLDGGPEEKNVLVGGNESDFCSFGPGAGDFRHTSCEKPSRGTANNLDPQLWNWDAFR
jgi:Ca2+-binding RTX toxin-like protein